MGIREITSELTDKGARLFRVNGKPVLVRGGGWSGDMLLREQPQRLEQQFEMVRDLHLNAIRLEGKLETDEFYRLADEQGVLVIAGWCCCDHVGAVGEMDAGELHGRGGLTARADAAHPQSSQPAGVAERQRQSSAAEGGADVSRYRARHALAESHALLGLGARDHGERRRAA